MPKVDLYGYLETIKLVKDFLNNVKDRTELLNCKLYKELFNRAICVAQRSINNAKIILKDETITDNVLAICGKMDNGKVYNAELYLCSKVTSDEIIVKNFNTGSIFTLNTNEYKYFNVDITDIPYISKNNRETPRLLLSKVTYEEASKEAEDFDFITIYLR